MRKEAASLLPGSTWLSMGQELGAGTEALRRAQGQWQALCCDGMWWGSKGGGEDWKPE